MTAERIQEFLDRLKDGGLSASSVNHYRTILNSIFNEAIRHGRYDANPIRAIHQFRGPPGRDRFLSIEQFRLLMAVLLMQGIPGPREEDNGPPIPRAGALSAPLPRVQKRRARKWPSLKGNLGGVDGTRTRDLRRDRRKG
jgi:integrase